MAIKLEKGKSKGIHEAHFFFGVSHEACFILY